MSDAPDLPPPGDADKAARRNRLMGRLILVGFGVLVLAYVAVTFLPH
jgi:hypothetical protein